MINDEDSTNDVCDLCNETIENCDCEVPCHKCEDAMPRKHQCSDDNGICPYCDEHFDDCNCAGANHY